MLDHGVSQIFLDSTKAVHTCNTGDNYTACPFKESSTL